MVPDGVDAIAHHGAFVVLLGFFQLFSRRHPCLVGDVKHFDGFGVRFITGL